MGGFTLEEVADEIVTILFNATDTNAWMNGKTSVRFLTVDMMIIERERTAKGREVKRFYPIKSVEHYACGNRGTHVVVFDQTTQSDRQWCYDYTAEVEVQ